MSDFVAAYIAHLSSSFVSKVMGIETSSALFLHPWLQVPVVLVPQQQVLQRYLTCVVVFHDKRVSYRK